MSTTGPPGQVPGPAGGAAAPGRRVGPAGCIVSVVVLLVGLGAAFGLFLVAANKIVGQIDSLPAVPVGSTRPVTIDSTGTKEVYLAALKGDTSLPSTDPSLTILDPDENPVVVAPATTSQAPVTSSSGLRTIGTFIATKTGTYTVRAGSVAGASSGVEVRIGPPAVDLVEPALAWVIASVVVGGLATLVGVVLGIIWLVRRSRAARQVPVLPPTGSGGPGFGGPGFGGPGFGGPPQPPPNFGGGTPGSPSPPPPNFGAPTGPPAGFGGQAAGDSPPGHRPEHPADPGDGVPDGTAGRPAPPDPRGHPPDGQAQ